MDQHGQDRFVKGVCDVQYLLLQDIKTQYWTLVTKQSGVGIGEKKRNQPMKQNRESRERRHAGI